VFVFLVGPEIFIFGAKAIIPCILTLQSACNGSNIGICLHD